MRHHLIGPLVLAVAACGDSGPSGNSLDDYVGTWTVEVEANDCRPAFELAFEVTQEDTDDGDPGFSGDWWLASNPADRLPYFGHVSETGQSFSFTFFVAPPSQQGLGFSGSESSPSGLTGTFLDVGGYIFGGPGCSGPAHATK